MPNELIIKWVIRAVGAALICLGLYMGYSHIKQLGYQEASVVYEARIAEYNNKLTNHIHDLESLSTVLSTNNQAALVKVDKDIKTILLSVKGIQPYTIIDGKCLPSPAFNDAYNKVVRKANE